MLIPIIFISSMIPMRNHFIFKVLNITTEKNAKCSSFLARFTYYNVIELVRQSFDTFPYSGMVATTHSY